MPHQCTSCGETFPDGSKEMLSGCPECGGNKFQFHPGEIPDEPTDEEPPAPDPPAADADAGVTGAVGRAANTVRDIVGGDREAGAVDAPADRATPDPDGAEPATGAAAEEPAAEGSTAGEPSVEADAGTENRAQADARSQVVGSDELPDVDEPSGADEEEAGPGLAELREELNDQFESIRIVDRGQYELNLMELYDRDEYIIALQENGRYVIEVADGWRGDADA